MPIPIDKKDQAVYHSILSDMHRLRSILLSLQTVDTPSTEKQLHEHFGRQQSVTLGKLTEWKNHRPSIYHQAHEDFQRQILTPAETSSPAQ